MVESKTGWMCLNCGHASVTKPADTPVTPIDVAPKPADKPAAEATPAPADNPATPDDVTAQISPKMEDALPPKTEPTTVDITKRSRVKPAERDDKPRTNSTIVVGAAAETAAENEAPDAMLEAPAAAPDQPAQEPSAPSTEPLVVTPAEPAWAEPVADSAPGAPTISELASGEPTPAPVGDVQPGETGNKDPLIAKTHPQGNSGRMLTVVAGLVTLGLAGAGAYAFTSPGTPLVGVLHYGAKATPSPTVAIVTASPAASESPSPTASAAPAADPTANNAQRQTDLAKYVAAYRATAVSGYFKTKPPAVSVSATDPSSNQAYTIVTTKPMATGQIYYWAGGQCGGAGFTPGKTSTKYLALETLLEGQTTPVCLDVK
jgi:hypothetical protein